MPTPNEEKRPIRRIPPSSLNFQNKKDGESEPERPAVVSPHPPKGKLKNSPLFEKIQANLALSPTALSPEVKLQAAPFPPVGGTMSPCSPLSPTLRAPPQMQASEEEVPVSFEQPAEGTPLPSINKCRARLSFKRRPPTRQHRQSASEDAGFSPTDEPNGDGADVFDGPAEGRTSPQSVVKETSEEGEEKKEETGAASEMQEKAVPNEQGDDEKSTGDEEPKLQVTQETPGQDAEEAQVEESQQVEEGAAPTIEEDSTLEGGDSSEKVRGSAAWKIEGESFLKAIFTCKREMLNKGY
ncbi:hypothetical protein ACEWY4_008790 [Coilia grayii]|uniref:FAM21/CAPZIP domain-containing protein n=1 Tax=Coilia grayii TaxID=363190 RepID=A0ABD1KBV8_9TELE